MCRLMVYMGSPIILDKLLYQPKNSLINQSVNAQELEEPLNGDGFGVGWYVTDVNYEPVTFVSVFPAWNNRNLRNLAPKIKTECLVAHVRAASVGDVSEANCHPFLYKNLLMLHNGGVEEFSKIKRHLRNPLSDELYNWIKGQTDSEHIFAFLIHYLNTQTSEINPETVMEAFEHTFGFLKDLMKRYDITEPAYFNMAFTNGMFIVATRYVSDEKEEPLTLYHSRGTHYICEDGVCQMVNANEAEGSVMVVSEKLTDLADDWIQVPKNHFVVVNSALDVSTFPIRA